MVIPEESSLSLSLTSFRKLWSPWPSTVRPIALPISAAYLRGRGEPADIPRGDHGRLEPLPTAALHASGAALSALQDVQCPLRRTGATVRAGRVRAGAQEPEHVHDVFREGATGRDRSRDRRFLRGRARLHNARGDELGRGRRQTPRS